MQWRVSTGFIVLSTCSIHCLVLLLRQCPIPLPVSVPAAVLSLLVFTFAALVILSISIFQQTRWLTEVTLLYMTSHVTIPMVTTVLSQTVS